MQNNAKYSIKITAEEGRTSGIVSIKKIGRDNRGVLAYAVPRARYAESLHNQDDHDRKLHENLNRGGVYILWEPSGWSGRHKAYIGESSTSVGDHLMRHHNTEDSFWQTAFVLVDRHAEEPLNSTQHRHLKAELYRRARAAGRCEVTNAQRPQHPQDIVRQDELDANEFLAEALDYLALLGIDAFREPARQMDIDRLFKFTCAQIAGLEPGLVAAPQDNASPRAPFKIRGKGDLNFATVHRTADELRITLNLPREKLYDPRGVAWDNTAEHQGTAGTVVTVTAMDQLPYIMGLIRQSFEKLAAGQAAEERIPQQPRTAVTAPAQYAPPPLAAEQQQSIGVSFEGVSEPPQPAAATAATSTATAGAAAAEVAVQQQPAEDPLAHLTFRFAAKAGRDGNYWNAVGRISPDNRFTVVTGSVARSSPAKSFTGQRAKMRTRLIEGGVLEKADSRLVFGEEYDFETPSLAASIIAGCNINGWQAWECEQDGRTLQELRAAELSSEDQAAAAAAARALEADHTFEFSRFNWSAEGRYISQGNRFVVLRGSSASHGATNTLFPIHAELRSALTQAGILVESDTKLVFTDDREFNSPSQAASVTSGAGENGLDAWRSKKDGRTLAEHLFGN